MFQRVGEETEKASAAKSDLTNGMMSEALVEDLKCSNRLVGLD